VVLEVAVLNVIEGRETAFEENFAQAAPLIASIPGYISHDLRRCIEKPNRYLLLVQWETLEAHTTGFRTSSQYEEWRKLLHHFYDPFPIVEHYVETAQAAKPL
jgi:heme-degrading monooxygenase HmoA